MTLALVGAVLVCEAAGWPFLARPAERALQHLSGRQVSLGTEGGGFRLRLLGGIRLDVDRLQVSNPAWAQAPRLLQADALHVEAAWHQLLAHDDGEPLPLQSVSARALQLHLERRADGQATWQLKRETAQAPADAARRGIDGVRVARLNLPQAHADVLDALYDAQLSIDVQGPPDGGSDPTSLWNATVQGQWRGEPVDGRATAGARLVVATPVGAGAAGDGDDAQDVVRTGQEAVPVGALFRVGASRLGFGGFLADGLGLQRWGGDFALSGPSLARMGEVLRVTLPATRAVSLQGRMQRDGDRHDVRVDAARIGRSQLAGQFRHQKRGTQVPLLTGQLTGSALWLEDLGPSIGVGADGAGQVPPRRAGRLLPDRRLDLPSLSAMDADVAVRLARLELGTPALRDLAPVRAHLHLRDSVLTLQDLHARSAEGTLTGLARVDATRSPADWRVDLKLAGLRLERWLQADRPAAPPPPVAGRLDATLQLAGRGASVAQMLAGANGRVGAVLREGRMSHLAVELAGLDLAQALGVKLRGDDALPLRCAAGDLQVRNGVATPTVLVADTRDSTLWVDGRISLADEQLQGQLHVVPHDVSPLALRAPLKLYGSWSQPQWRLDRSAIARRVVPAALLAAINPLLALVPLVDRAGSEEERVADHAVAGCEQLAGANAARGPGSAVSRVGLVGHVRQMNQQPPDRRRAPAAHNP